MKDMTTGKEWKVIVGFVIPMLIGNVFQQMYNMVDSIIVGRYLGKEALAAVGTSFPILFLVLSLIMGITMGSGVLIAQYYGAKNMEQLRKTLDTTNIVMSIGAIILTIICLIFSDKILMLLSTPKEVFDMSKEYLNIIFIGLFPVFGYNTLSSILRGIGDSKSPLYFLIVAVIVNIILDIVFIRYMGLGVAGAAWATVIAQSCSFIFAILSLNKMGDTFKIRFRNLKFDKSILRLILKIGLPTSIQQVCVSLGMMAIQGLVNGFGPVTMAGYNAASKIDTFATMPMMNFSAAISTFVGQNIGAQKIDRVKKGASSTLMISTGLSIVTAIIIYFVAEPLVSLFTTDKEVIQAGVQYLRIVPIFYFAFNILFVTSGAVRGAGYSIPPMICAILATLIVRVPVAYYFAGSMGPKGIWLSAGAGWSTGAILNYAYYKFKDWHNTAPQTNKVKIKEEMA